MLGKLLRREKEGNLAEMNKQWDAEHMAFLQTEISSAISTHKDLLKILELIAREALSCLKGHRSSIFFMEEKSGILKTDSIYCTDLQDAEVGLYEEKEIAKRSLKEGEPFLLKEPKDFSEILKYRDQKPKISSLMSIPIYLRGKPVRTISLVLIDGGRKFNEKDLQFLSILGNNASIAMGTVHLLEEVRKAVSSKNTYEQYLDKILEQLQGISGNEQRRIGEHVEGLISAQKGEPGQKVAGLDVETKVAEELGIERRQEKRIRAIFRVEFADEYLGFTGNLSCGGAFIRTENPMEVREQFSMKLHLFDGKEPIEVRCKVIWSNQYGKESKHFGRGMGVKFLNLEEEARKRIRENIESIKFSAVGEIGF